MNFFQMFQVINPYTSIYKKGRGGGGVCLSFRLTTSQIKVYKDKVYTCLYLARPIL